MGAALQSVLNDSVTSSLQVSKTSTTCSKGQPRSYFFCKMNLASISVINWETCKFCKNFRFLSYFDVYFHIQWPASSAVFLLFLFSSWVCLECLLLSALCRSLSLPPTPKHLHWCLTMSRLLQGNGRESLWLGSLITIQSLIQTSIWTDGTLAYRYIRMDLS